MSSSSRNNKHHKDHDLGGYVTNFANLSSTSTTSSSNSSNSSLFSSTATTSTSPCTSSTDYSSISDGDDSDERHDQYRKNKHINKNRRNCALTKAQKMTTHATLTNNHNNTNDLSTQKAPHIRTNIVDNDDDDDDDDDLDEMLSSISSPTKRSHSTIKLQIDSDDDHDALDMTHHRTSGGQAVKKQRTLNSMFVTKTVSKSEVNRKDNDSHDPFQSQLDPFAFSSQDTIITTAKPTTCTPIGRKTKNRLGKQQSTSTTLPISLKASPKQLSATPSRLPGGSVPITIDSDHNDEDLSQLPFATLTPSTNSSHPFHPSSHSTSNFKHPTFLSSYHPNIFVHKAAYRSLPRAPLGNSDHCLIQMVPIYKQKLKLARAVQYTSKRWTTEAIGMLQDCLDTTDWESMRASCDSMDSYTDTVCSYISFCEQACIPTKTVVKYNNNKPWFTKSLRLLRETKEQAYREGKVDEYRLARQKLNKAIRKAKSAYKMNMEEQFGINDSSSAWRSLKNLTGYKNKKTTSHSIH